MTTLLSTGDSVDDEESLKDVAKMDTAGDDKYMCV